VTSVTDGGVREPTMPRTLVHRSLPLAAVLVALLAGTARADDLAAAKAAVEAKDWVLAVDHLAKALATDPPNREAALLAARVAEKSADAFPLAEGALGKLLRADAKDRDARLALARTFLAHGRSQAADPGATGSVAAYFADAADQFQKALEASGGSDEDAAAGVVEAQHSRGAFDEALTTADAFLAKHPKAARVNFWKGQALYVKASDRVKAQNGEADAEAKALFARAKGAYEAATMGEPTSFDAWLQLAYAAQWTGNPADRAAALQAYEKAVGLDAESEFPVKGIAALLTHDQKAYVATLERLAKEHPKSLPVRWYLAWKFFSDKRHAEATRVLSALVKEHPKHDAAWALLGHAYAGQGDAAKAKTAFETSLGANPDNQDAAAQLESAIQAKLGQNLSNPKAALELAAAYKPLLEAAPRNPWLRNNLGFVLRESLNAGATRKGEMTEVSAAWLPVLKESARVYVEAAEAIGEWRPEVSSMPWTQRHNYAGVLNDAGLMLWYYPQVRDVAKAKDLYRRALEFTDSGHRDACMNLIKLYEEEGDKDGARSVAEDCAERLMDEKGGPDEPGRAAARKKAESLQ
jgi:tetratricopeptide (TPR) repeat protein